jgi:hypothetical protein
MSAFEFVLVALAIILGFGISEILAGWGGQLRVRHRLKPYPLQLASSAFILWLSLQYLWGLWVAQGIEWTFPVYLLVSAPALALALAAHVTRVDTAPDAPSVREQYFQNSRPVYTLIAAFPVFILAMSLIPSFREGVPDPPNLLLITLIRLGVFSLMVSLAWSRSERYHWVALGALWLTAIGMLSRLVFRLVEQAA